MSTYPNANSMSGLESLLAHLRNSFPATVDSGTLKKLGIAPNNESYVINTIRFLGLIDEESRRTEAGQSAFVKDGEEFTSAFAKLITSAYHGLFELHQDNAWTLTQDKLVSFFRQEDSTSREVARRQANTFIKLCEFAAKREAVNGTKTRTQVTGGDAVRIPREVVRSKPKAERKGDNVKNPSGRADVSLGVRIEVILPQSSDQSVYDAIFRSIRENLISGE